MIPSTTHIMKKRHATTRRLRFLSFVLILTGAIFFCLSLMTWLIEDLDVIPYQIRWGLGTFSAFAAPALAAVLLSSRLIKWLVPLGNSRCPGCEYELKHLTEPRCPECGLEIETADRRIDRADR